jgi:hypothetical protein
MPKPSNARPANAFSGAVQMKWEAAEISAGDLGDKITRAAQPESAFAELNNEILVDAISPERIKRR